MKTVKSANHLERLAFSRGASASLGDVRFNSSASKGLLTPAEVKALQPLEPIEPIEPIEPVKVEVKPEAPTEIKAEVKPEPVDLAPILQSAVDAMAASVSEVAKDSARVMAEVCKAVERMSAPEVEPKKPVQWTLKVNRDLRGLMETVDIKQVL